MTHDQSDGKTMPEYGEILLHTREEWRDWLAQNHETCPGIWLIYHKKHTGVARVAYDDAVEEALCFGWIDSTAKRLDDARYMQKYTPRKRGSHWSALNRGRAEALMKAGAMEPAGLASIEAAKKNGAWEKALEDRVDRPMPPELKKAMAVDPEAAANFGRWSPTQRKLAIHHVAEAKRPETRDRRAAKLVALARSGKRPGM
jgi:uncharacterized protein YdeI (YjbR/CyaY-like superfamily)